MKGSVEDGLDVIVWLHEGKRIIAIHDNAKKVFHRFNVSECKLPTIPNLQRLRINMMYVCVCSIYEDRVEPFLHTHSILS